MMSEKGQMKGIPLADLRALRELSKPYTRPVSDRDMLDLIRARREFIAAQPDVTLTLSMIPDGDWLGARPRRGRPHYRQRRHRRKLRYVMRRR
jgi:hypothetical protein